MKTAVLIAASILNEFSEPVIYLAPTVQLVQQALQKANEYNIAAVAYEKGTDFPDDFLIGNSVLICTYQALFNGRSRFGIRGSNSTISAAAIILDDAHVAFASVRNAFTLKVNRNDNSESYDHLTNIFRNDFNELGKIGSFDDIVSGVDSGILEVPYWSWKAKSDQVREFLRNKPDNDIFVWPFIRDSFDYCHSLISRDSFVISPILPLVDQVPTFEDCPRRIFMSATISDDNAIIRTFDAKSESINKPITSKSLAGVSERMILAPELMPFSIDDLPKMLKDMGQWSAKKKNVGTTVLVPSRSMAKSWEDTAQFADSTDKVTNYVNQLLTGQSYGPFVFANRYDGIDLPGTACRLLILSGLPRGSNEYDQYRANTFAEGEELSSALAQRIEQGMGRGARGAGDYCVVIVTGNDLTSWFGRSSNLKFLTKSTRAQFEMGVEISKNIADKKDFYETILRCLDRDRDWIEYHAERLADLTDFTEDNMIALDQAAIERKVFRLLRSGYFEKAIKILKKYIQENSFSESKKLDSKSRGWLNQLAARIAYYWGRDDLAQQFQESAYSDNYNLLRPQVIPPYIPLTIPGKQAELIVSEIDKYNPRRGYLSQFEEQVAHLVPEASSNQFEQALASLGSILGFHTERPDNIYRVGPDVLWLLTEDLGLVIEAKSRKNKDNAFNKDQHGQLLNAEQWFKQAYPSYACIRVSVHSSSIATKSTIPGQSKVLTFDTLNQLIADTRKLLSSLCESTLLREELIVYCEDLLTNSTLKYQSIIDTYLVPFEIEQN